MSRKSAFGKTTHASQLAITCNRCVLYVRASTLDQVNSLDAQKSKAVEFAKAKGLVIEETFIDSGVSAIKHNFLDRPQAKRMLAYIKKHAISSILVLRLDRLIRNPMDFCLTTTRGLEEGFYFRFMDPDIDYGTPMGRMFAQIQASLAQLECELRAQRVDDAYDSLRERRIARTNQAGYGWELGPLSDLRARKSGELLHTLVPIPAEQAVLRHAKQLWDAPGKPFGKLTSIAALFNELRIPTKVPAGTTLRRIYGKGTPQQRTREIITDGTWKPVNVKSILAHAVLATDAELPDGLPTFQQAAVLLSSNPQSTILNLQSPISSCPPRSPSSPNASRSTQTATSPPSSPMAVIPAKPSN